jgi:hypothetical protein
VHEITSDRIERAERLVEEKDASVLRECPRECNALAHTSRQLVRKLVVESVQVDTPQKVACVRRAGTAAHTA